MDRGDGTGLFGSGGNELLDRIISRLWLVRNPLSRTILDHPDETHDGFETWAPIGFIHELIEVRGFNIVFGLMAPDVGHHLNEPVGLLLFSFFAASRIIEFGDPDRPIKANEEFQSLLRIAFIMVPN